MHFKLLCRAVASTLLLAGCGGGGSSSSTPATPPTPAPTVFIAASQPKIALGSAATLTWSSTNATSCTATGGWSGAQAAAGTSAQTPSTSGVIKYTLTCTGFGGSAVASADLTVPIPVQKSSYENKSAAAEVLGPQKLPGDVPEGNAVAFGDFFQDGSYSMVTHSLEYNAQDPSTANKFGHIHFWKSVNGTWIDNTSTLLPANTGCLHPRKAVVADFNGDGKPDVFFACHGFDAPPFPGESPIALLSQADGTYKRTVAPVTGFIHNASAADVNGDGFADVLIADNITAGQPYFLMNNKDGTFTADMTRLPADTKYKPIFTTEMIDFGQTGKYDVFLGGHEQSTSANWPATILPNDGSGNFGSTTRVVLPSLQGFGFPTDIVFTGGSIYLARTIDDSANFYGGSAIQKITYPGLVSQSLLQRTTPYASGTLWINWIIPFHGAITGLDSMYGISVPQ